MTSAADRVDDARARRISHVVLGLAVLAVVGVSLARVVRYGFAPVAADDAQYIGAGRALWGFHKPLVIDGSLYTIRSWVYPLMVGGASRLMGSDPFLGPKLLVWALGTGAFALAVVIAYRLARAAGAVVTALLLLMTPLLWLLVPSTLVDVALMAFTVTAMLVIAKPTPNRMLAAGVVVGLTLLVKETSAPLVVLPLAYLGTMPSAHWRKLATRFVVAWAITVGWWFVTVLVATGDVFPLQGIREAANRDVPRAWSLTASTTLLVAAWAVGWIVVAIGRRNEPYSRVLVLSGLAFVPAAGIALQKGFALRQFGPLALLSAIALGVAVADGFGVLAHRTRARAGSRVVMAVAVVLVAVALVPVVLTQDRVAEADSSGELDRDIARAISVEGRPKVVSSFRYKVQLWARLQGNANVQGIVFKRSSERPALGRSVWVESQRGEYLSMPRDQLAARLTGARYLVLTGPHRLAPIGLATWLQQHGADIGFSPVGRYGNASGGLWAYVFRLEHPRVDRIPTILTTTAAERLAASGELALARPTAIAGPADALARLGATLPAGSFEPVPAPLR